ncbi:hypothetical protein [uncultured Lactobacillus sp.]|uniref:hypothetical protein n=1 Tax=uncultured Lactobacillus sp. TaxID=153152 RepID=UPI0025CBFEF4|nr:hypothetical protein [uncultured Lactobacillus sp.]
MGKLSEAKIRANRKWNAKNKDRKDYLRYRSTAKNFILKKATLDDLIAINSYVEERKKQLKTTKNR